MRSPTVVTNPFDSKFPASIAHMLRAESITTVALLPLSRASGPIGMMSRGSRREKRFGQADLDLLSQVSSQISLAIDNALAYGRLTASRDPLEDQRLYLESEITSEYSFEDLVDKTAAFEKVLSKYRSSLRPFQQSCFTERQALGKAHSSSHSQSQCQIAAHICKTQLCRNPIRAAGKRTVRA